MANRMGGLPRELVLVVEDDPEIRLMLAEILHEEGYRVRAVVNGREALDVLHAEHELPSLILLDLMMPEMDGWTFRALQRADARLAHIPVVVLTAHASDIEELAPAAFLHKPLAIQPLVEVLERLVPRDRAWPSEGP